MNKILLAAGCLTALILLALTAHRIMAPPTPLVIGCVSSLTGRFAALGATCRDGALLAVEELNARGGVAGRPLVLTVKDDQSTPSRTPELFRELAAEGASAVAGPYTSASGVAALPVINELGLVTVGPTTAADALAGQDDFFLKLYPSTHLFGESLANLAARIPGVDRVAIVADTANREYAEPIISRFTDILTAQGRPSPPAVLYDSKAGEPFPDLAARCLQHRPQAVLFIASALDTAMLAQQLRLRVPEMVLLSSSWAATGELLQNGGRAVEGLYFFMPLAMADASPEYQAFAQAYERRFGTRPSYGPLFFYEAVLILARGLAADPQARGPALKRLILAQGPHRGVQHSFALDAAGDAQRPLYLHQIRNGTFVTAGAP